MSAMRALATRWQFLPKRTVRLRLTLLFGGLFLIMGAGLLALNYVLFINAKQVVAYRGDNGLAGTVDEPGRPPENPAAAQEATPELSAMPNQLEYWRDQAIAQLADTKRELLTQSGIALLIMVAVSVMLGWVIAGRVLRRLRTITRAVQEISVTDLHRRLDLPGPADELKELGDTFDGLLARLDVAFQTQRQFVANASHELLTPLARQRVISQVVLSDDHATIEALREAHQRVLVAGQQQQQLIQGLLTLARGQAGLAAREPFDLADVAGQVIAGRTEDAASRGLSLRTQLDAARTAGDPRLCERLVTNLVDNALRHNAPGGWLELATGVENHRPVVRVTNTGPEVPDAAIERLFQPFQRLVSDRTTGVEGYGLGLSIIKAIAGAHDATVAAQPRPGGGLTISIAFPSVDADAFSASTSPALASGPR